MKCRKLSLNQNKRNVKEKDNNKIPIITKIIIFKNMSRGSSNQGVVEKIEIKIIISLIRVQIVELLKTLATSATLKILLPKTT
jgi:hypothetical protein